MRFITNYALDPAKCDTKWSPTAKQKKRRIHFHPFERVPGASVYFCNVDSKGAMHEFGSQAFLGDMKGDIYHEVLLYIHGFNNTPKEVFDRARELQRLFDSSLKGHKRSIEVVPLLWPCDDDMGIIKDYWDDQESADMSSYGFSRVLGKFMQWRKDQTGRNECYRPINILSHSMGNRVLRLTLDRWNTYHGQPPTLFKNIFMFAADIVNESLEKGKSGHTITTSSRTVSVYHAGDDLAMTASKVSNAVSRTAFSKRLGHTGPEDMDRAPNNVYSIDCGSFNNEYDFPKGHTYFSIGKGKTAGKGFKHMLETVKTGRVKTDAGERTLTL